MEKAVIRYVPHKAVQRYQAMRDRMRELTELGWTDAAAKCMPHQGPRECARRMRQAAREKMV